MNGAIFYSGQYGSTAQYAQWISDATGLPAFDIKDKRADPSKYDYLILGSSVIIHKLSIRKWVQQKLTVLNRKPIVLFSVSGAGAGSKLDSWIAESLPEDMISRMDHVALRGKLDHKDITWFLKLTLAIGAAMNKDPQARKEELEGFDYMDKSSITPIVALIQRYQSSENNASLRQVSSQATPA